ncbi:MAG: leucine-rich repeat domain-containing protein [Clostridiales bacterium]|nr:leucine-rich repeat domain-containing protein [Clostridiales bacterium]
MKKLIKIISLILSLCVFSTLFACMGPGGDVGSAGGGAGNGDGEHTTHTYVIVKYDNEFHWKECSCGEQDDFKLHDIIGDSCECGFSFSQTPDEDDKDDGGSSSGGGGSGDSDGPSAPPVQGDGTVSFGLDFSLEKNGTEYSVAEGSCNDRNVIIPATYNGLPVTRIWGDNFNTTTMVSITIPETVVEIGNSPFPIAKNLVNIEVAENNPMFKSVDGVLYSKDGKTLIKYGAGKDASNLEIPKEVTTIGSYAFCRSKSLRSIEIPNGVEKIDSFAFYMCEFLKSVKMPDTVKELVGGAFSDCVALSEVNLSNGLVELSEKLFNKCESLTKIEIPDSVKYIHGSFRNCTALEEVKLSNNVEWMSGTFFNCKKLKTISLPNTLTNISYETFSGCESLQGITLPDNLMDIGSSAFAGCKSLTKLHFPATLTGIGYNAFDGCTGLTEVTYGGSTGDWGVYIGFFNREFFQNTSITKVICSDGSVNVK